MSSVVSVFSWERGERKLKFGACLNWRFSSFLKKAGGDFIELPLSQIAQMEDEEWKELNRSLALPAEVFNVFLPGSLKIVGENRDWGRIEGYLRQALPRARSLGGEVIVFGSGGSRRAPEGFPPGEARDQLLEFLSLASEIAEEESLSIAVEHLNSSETNTINRFEEALRLVEDLGRGNVGVLADIYHLIKEGEELEVVKHAGEKLFHIHISDPERNPPLRKEIVIEEFLYLLKEMGYKKRISIESKWGDIEKELPQAIEALKEEWRCAYGESFS